MIKRLGIVTGAFFAAILLFGLTVPSTGLAKATCSTGVTTIAGTVNGGLTVTGGTCVVIGATIHGGIDQSGGNLTVCGSKIDGGLNATGGSVDVLGEADTGSCAGNQINGHISFSGLNFVELDSDTIHGGADVDSNDFAEVESNDIKGSLNCAGNTAIIDDGHPNSVTGAETGQCSGF
jgi:hypothetical protein